MRRRSAECRRSAATLPPPAALQRLVKPGPNPLDQTALGVGDEAPLTKKAKGLRGKARMGTKVSYA